MIVIKRCANGCTVTLSGDDGHTTEVFPYDDDNRDGWCDVLRYLTELMGPVQNNYAREGAFQIRVMPGRKYEPGAGA